MPAPIIAPDTLTVTDRAWLDRQAALAGCVLVTEPPVLYYDPALISYPDRRPKQERTAR